MYDMLQLRYLEQSVVRIQSIVNFYENVLSISLVP